MSEGIILPETQDSGKILNDAWDFKGRQAIRSQTGGWFSAVLILGVELCERLTTLGIAVNLVTYLTGTMHMGNANAANDVTNFFGTSFMLCLFGGFIADTYLGRYLTIAIFTAVQATGVTILTISTAVPGLRPVPCTGHTSSCVPASGSHLGVLYLALYLTALGTGGLKSSVSGFGSDQFDESYPLERKHMMKFFGWFFFFISLGSLVAVTVLVYIQDNVGRSWGYGIIAVAIVLGLVLFISGTPRYRFKKLAGSPLTQIAAVVVGSWRKRGCELPSDPLFLYDVDKVQGGESTKEKASRSKLPHTKQFRFLDRAAIIEGPGPTDLQTKWSLSTLTDVEEIKMIIRMLPIWATTIIFWTVYAQMSTFSVAQATKMDRHIGPSFQIPSGSLTVFFVSSILLTVPFYDRILAPVCRRVTGNPQGLTPLQKIALGLVMSIFAMAAAALIEHHRLHEVQANAATMTVFWLVPQFLLVGSGEAFCYMGQLDFFLRECPKGMKSMSTGLFLSTLSLGCFFSSVIVAIVHKVTGESGPGAWLPDDLNKGRLDDFYWLVAALSTANLALFLLSAKWYVYKETRMGMAEDGMELEDVDEASRRT